MHTNTENTISYVLTNVFLFFQFSSLNLGHFHSECQASKHGWVPADEKRGREQGSVTCSDPQGWASRYNHRPQRPTGIQSSVHVYGPHEWIKILLHYFIFWSLEQIDITISIWEMRELSLKKKVMILPWDTTFINKRNRARIQFHLIITLDRYLLLNFLILEHTNWGTDKARVEVLLRTAIEHSLLSSLESVSSPFYVVFFFFWVTVHTPQQASRSSPIMSAEVWCFHYAQLGKFPVLWQSAESTPYKSEDYGKFRNERNLLQTWGAESSSGLQKMRGFKKWELIFWIPAGNKTKLNKTVALKNTFPSFSEELVYTICLPLNIFSFVLAEVQEDGVHFPFILQAEESPEMGRSKQTWRSGDMRKLTRLDSWHRIMFKHVNFCGTPPAFRSWFHHWPALRSFIAEDNGFGWKHLEYQ